MHHKIKTLIKKYQLLSIIVILIISVFLSFPVISYGLEIKKDEFNGMTILHMERHNLPIVAVTLLIKASPINEPENLAGLAYLTSQMLTKGTANRTASEISEEIEFIGATLNTSTNSDYTVISLSILKRDIEKGMDILSDLLLNPTFPEEELKKKKELIKASLRRGEESPSFIAEREFIREVFGRHPYARLVTGSIETIDNIKREDIVNFFREYYLPENSILSIVGNITSEELASLLKNYLGLWKMGERIEIREQITLEKSGEGTKKIIINKDITQANIILGHIGISRDDPDYYAVTVMNYILGGGGFASRLMKKIRDELGLTYSIYSSFSVNKEIGMFKVDVQTKNEYSGIVIKEILNQIEKIRKEPVTDEELENAKSFLTGSFPRRLETTIRISDFLANMEFYNLGDDYIKKYPDYINSVTKEDILRVARKYLNPENYVLVIVGDEKKITLE